MLKSFKKIISVLLSAALVIGAFTALPLTANASGTGVIPEFDASEYPGNDSSIWFWADPDRYKNYDQMNCFIYVYGSDEDVVDKNGKRLNSWGSKTCKMESAGNNFWYMDFNERGIELDPNKAYACIFAGGRNGVWGARTCDLLFDENCFGIEHAAYCGSNQTENPIDSLKRDYVASWQNVDASKYGPPLCITSIGNVIGSAVPNGQTKYGIFVRFLYEDDFRGLRNAVRFNAKSEQKIIDDAAGVFGLSKDEIRSAVNEANEVIRESGSDYQISWRIEDSNVGDIIPGDVNGDGDVDVTDATFVQMYAARLIAFDGEMIKAADVNGDSKVDITDATLIQMCAAKLIAFDDEIIG